MSARSTFSARRSPGNAKSLAGASEIKRLRYRGEYSLDVAESAISTDPVFGTVGGAIVALSDLLGNDQYYFLLYNTAQTQSDLLSSFNVAISHISMGQRTNYAYGIYRFTGRRYDLTVSDDYFYERVYGGYFAMSYPLSKFERIETSVSLSNSNRELIGDFVDRRALLLSNSLSFVHDNSLWGPSGPLDGNAFSLTLAYTSDVQYSNVNYYSDHRRLQELPAPRHAERLRLPALAVLQRREGIPAVRHGRELGPPRLAALVPARPETLADEPGAPVSFHRPVRRPVPVRRDQLLVHPGGPVLRRGERLGRPSTRRRYGSMGGGLRMNLGGVLVLRYDIGKRIENNFTSLQTGLFTQFFFGWDF